MNGHIFPKSPAASVKGVSLLPDNAWHLSKMSLKLALIAYPVWHALIPPRFRKDRHKHVAAPIKANKIFPPVLLLKPDLMLRNRYVKRVLVACPVKRGQLA